ncbi:MAG TPA: hypothetical protein VEU08_04935 [Vicinamibacterales bacterium]|nr:hypothetical protein [Vicinamibacterales bacterium]
MAAPDAMAAIAAANALLPGPIADAVGDARCRAILDVGVFAESDPEAVWPFITRWTINFDPSIRAAVGTYVLERLLEHHFDAFIARIEEYSRKQYYFRETVVRCWRFGQASAPARVKRIEKLKKIKYS